MEIPSVVHTRNKLGGLLLCFKKTLLRDDWQPATPCADRISTGRDPDPVRFPRGKRAVDPSILLQTAQASFEAGCSLAEADVPAVPSAAGSLPRERQGRWQRLRLR